MISYNFYTICYFKNTAAYIQAVLSFHAFGIKANVKEENNIVIK